MNSSKNLETNLDEFKKITGDLSSIDHKLEDETQAIILLRSLPDKYKDVCNGILYRCDYLSLDLAISNLISKELEIISNDSSSEGIITRDKYEKMSKWIENRNRSKFKGKFTIMC